MFEKSLFYECLIINVEGMLGLLEKKFYSLPRKTKRQMTIHVLRFYLDNIFLVVPADKIYTGVNEGIKKLLLYSLII